MCTFWEKLKVYNTIIPVKSWCAWSPKHDRRNEHVKSIRKGLWELFYVFIFTSITMPCKWKSLFSSSNMQFKGIPISGLFHILNFNYMIPKSCSKSWEIVPITYNDMDVHYLNYYDQCGVLHPPLLLQTYVLTTSNQQTHCIFWLGRCIIWTNSIGDASWWLNGYHEMTVYIWSYLLPLVVACNNLWIVIGKKGCQLR